MNLKIELLPKQLLLKNLIENSPYTWIGYGGARGGAKSWAIRELAVYFGYKYGAKSLIFRRYSNELLDTHIYPLFKDHPEIRKSFNKTEKTLYDYKGNPIIKFGYADGEDDIYVFQGAEYDFIFIDEATQTTQKMIEFLRTSNRSTNENLTAKMILTMNPGGVGHGYIKRLFIDKKYQENEIADEYVFIQAHVWDNAIWVSKWLKKEGLSFYDYYHKFTEQERIDVTLKHSDYAKNLASLPEELKLAYLYGNWDIFGGMFFKTFDKKKEVISPFEIPSDWKLIASIDPGFKSPCSVGLMAQDYEGKVYRIATYYEEERNPYDHAQAIKEWLDSDTIKRLLKGRKPSIWVSGKDAFARKDRYSIMATERTFADMFMDAGIFLTPAVTDRRQGWWALKSLMPNKFFIFDGLNKPLLEEILAVESDPRDPEDIFGKGANIEVRDHALDEVRYGIMSLFKPIMAKEEQKNYDDYDFEYETYNEVGITRF